MPTKKEQCKEIMGKLFGPATAGTIEAMSEDDCVDKCKAKVKAFLGEEKAALFDAIK